MDFFDVFTAVFSLLIMAIPGIILARLKILPDSTENGFSTFVLYIGQSFLVFMAFQKPVEFNDQLLLNMFFVALLAFVMHFLMFFIYKLCIRGKKEAGKKKIVRYAGIFSNCGFMGLPFLEILFPSSPEIMIYGAMVITVFNVLNWTLGVYMITGSGKDISVKKVVLNPVIISVMLGIVSFFIFNGPIISVFTEGTKAFTFASGIEKTFTYLSGTVTPLSMFVIGLKLGKMNFKSIFNDFFVYLASFNKLILMSLIAILLVAFLPLDIKVKYVVFFLLSMPSATSSVLFAVKFNGDSDFASKCVLLSTVMSIVSLPLMFMLANLLF